MTNEIPQELREQLEGLVSDVKNVKTEAQKAGVDLDGRVSKIAEETERNGKAFSETKDAFEKQSVEFNNLLAEHKELTQKMSDLGKHGAPATTKTLGEMAVESEHIKNHREGSSWQGKAFLVDEAQSGMGLVGQQKAVSSAGASAGPLLQTQTRDGIMYDPLERLTIRDLLTVLPTSFSSVEWFRELLFTNSAATVAEGAAKPESDITFEKDNTSMKVIAHWIKASNQILADVPRLRAHIDMRMTHGLKLVEEQQLLLGDGTGENLTGLIPSATAYADDASVGADAGDTHVDQLRRSILQAELARYPADSIIMHPTDWANIELMKTTDNAYLFTNPQTGTGAQLWGRRVVTSTAMPVGQYLTGSLQMGATLYDREQMSVRLADQHGDTFIHNQVVILVEERIGLAIERPQAIIKGTFA